MIIGISGKIGSGKDTIGIIIQALTWRDGENRKSLYEVVEWVTGQRKESLDDTLSHNFKIVKFADKLKETVSLMTGIPRQDLELQSVKDSFLPAEWNHHYLKFKDGRPDELVPEGKDPVAWQRRFAHIGEVYLKQMTVRELLQKVGTNAIRNQVHYNAWRNATMADYKGWEERYPQSINGFAGEGWYHHSHCATCKNSFTGFKRQQRCEECIRKEPILYPNWVITDVRFPNEVLPIDLLIRVNRPTTKRVGGTDDEPSVIGTIQSAHPSETALDTYPFKTIIQNDGSIEDLIEKVRVILVENKIIK